MTRLVLVVCGLTACLERGGELAAPPTEVASQPAAIAERQDPAGVPARDAALRVRLEAEPTHLLPLLSGDGLAVRVALGDIYEGLLCRDRDTADPLPCLAESYSVSSDGKHWRFALRRGVRFHSGAPLSEEDVVRSIEVVARGLVATPLTSEFDDLVSVNGQGGQIDVVFADHRLDRVGGFARLPIAPASRLSGDLDLLALSALAREPDGTGPLAFRRWHAGESIELERNRDYWGTESGAASIIYKIVGSRELAYAMARNGKLDLASQLPIGEALDVAAPSPQLGVYTYERPAYLAAVFNARREPMSSAAGRRGLTMLLDCRAVIGAIMADRASPISGPFVGDEADPAISPLPFDVQSASTLLAPVSLEVLYPLGSRTMARLADIWASDARGVVTLVPRPLPFAAVLERARGGDFDIVLLSFTSGAELDLYTRLHSSQIGGENYGAISDRELDEALVRVREATSDLEIVSATRAVHRLLDRLVPYAFIATDTRAGLIAADIGLGGGDGLAARHLFRVEAAP